MIAGYMTVAEAAEKWEIDVRTVQLMCSQEKIEGVTKFGKCWAIPADTDRPDDKRVKSGRYRGWRKATGKKTSDN